MDDVHNLYTEFMYFPELAAEPQYEVCYFSMRGRGERIDRPIPSLPSFALEMTLKWKEERQREEEENARNRHEQEWRGDNPAEQLSSDTGDSLRADEDTGGSDVQVRNAIIAARAARKVRGNSF